VPGKSRSPKGEPSTANSQRKGSKEARKAKKAQPPKSNASRPFLKGPIPALLKG